jgi:hypothetical protein
MRFLLIISHDENFTPTPQLVANITAWTKKQRRDRVLIDGNPLKPAGEAVTVRIREGQLRRTAGPFARSREKMCAYALIEAEGMAEAVSLASGHPMAKVATIEVRPVWQELAGK